MKKIPMAMLIFALLFNACDDGSGNDDNDDNNDNETTLTITNMNISGLIEVKYGTVDFGVIGFLTTESVTKEVTAGMRYAYITDHYLTEAESASFTSFSPANVAAHKQTCTCPVYRTNSITCEEGKNTQLNLTKNTVVTLIQGFGYDEFGNVPGTFQDIADSVTASYTEYMNLLIRGFNAIQTQFWDAIEEFNNAPNGTTQTITLTDSFEFPSVSAYSVSQDRSSLFKKGQNKKIIIQGDSYERTISNSGKKLVGYFQNTNSDSLIIVPEGITLELGNNIAIDGNDIPFSTVIVEAGGTFIMNNGSTVKNTKDSGVEVEGAFTMNGGTISGNRYSARYDWGITSSGGGVSVRKGGTFTMNGGTIRDNTNYDEGFGGGGVSIVDGTFTMKGGTISGNKTDPSQIIYFSSRGGGVFVSANGSFTKSGGTIDDTNDAEYGKVVYVNRTAGADMRETTAGPSDNLNSAISGAGGGWDED